MKKLVDSLIQFFIPSHLDREKIPQAKLLCLSAPVIGLLTMAVFLFPPEPDEILVGFGLFGSLLLLCIPFIIKFSENYNLSSAVFTSVSLALFPLCLFEYGGMYSPVLVWLPLMPVLLGYLLGWKEGAKISGLLAIELLVLSFLESITVHTISTLLAMAAGVLLSYRLESKKRNSEFQLSDTQSSLQEALRVKELFWNNISHEIRTPLNGILGMTQILMEAKHSKEQEELLRIIKESGIHLKAVLNDVVDYSQLELGDLKLKKEPLVIQDSFAKVISMFDEYLLEKDVQLSFEIHRFFPEALLTDSYRVKQVLIHLVSNAVKFTNSGFIKVRAELTDEENVFLFSVTDSGKGIKKQAHSKIFTTFYQGDLSSTREHGGAGLGLALCKRLVDLLGGKIEFESAPGKGSHFFFTIKAMPLDLSYELQSNSNNVLTPTLTEFNLNQIMKKEDQRNKERESHGLNVLVVEDNPVNLTLMETLLKQLGHRVSLSENGREALEELEKHDYDIIFMDIQMPIMDGIKCTKQILKLYGEDRPAIVAVTANVHQREECLKIGFDDFIGKPINISKIKDVLSKLLSTHRSYIQVAEQEELEMEKSEEVSTKIDVVVTGPDSLFDAKSFVENFGNDQEIIQFLVEQFKESAPRLIDEIDQALSENNFVKLEASAHSLKGALSNFFCLELREIASQLEHCARKKDSKNALGLYYELKNQVSLLQSELDENFGQKKAAS
ncbi:MAG: hypothetical protein CME70_24360 [Halobacteriovorax sp.]|nr:hypothetical protein [Halobacteriovorax sp.]|tara:strand:+ start:49224 stop:51401 length:2178 start_codon:yes stop_codon:yes gene_type:complete